jgi:hypothetical protein
MLDIEINFYKANRLQFIADHHNKYLVIKGAEVIGIYDTNSQAQDEAIKMAPVGTFIVEHPIDLALMKADKTTVKR